MNKNKPLKSSINRNKRPWENEQNIGELYNKKPTATGNWISWIAVKIEKQLDNVAEFFKSSWKYKPSDLNSIYLPTYLSLAARIH